MKGIVLLTCIGTLALALTASGAPREKQGSRSARSRSAPAAHAVPARGSSHISARTSRSVGPRIRTHSVNRASTARSRVGAAKMRSAWTSERAAKTGTVGRNRTALNRERAVARTNAVGSTRTETVRTRNARIAEATKNTARTTLAANRQRNLTFAHNVLANHAGDVRITNNWRSDRFRGANYAAFYNYNRQWHDRGWWRSHHTKIVFVLGGWWYWNLGYWYPAWGYDPYAWYWYDGPIYTGYATLTPDQVIVNVQIALRDQGYYAGPIDGSIGPQTRASLAAYQADNGLAVTSAIDSSTLANLGLA